MPPVGLKPTVSAGERPQTYVLDRAATGTGSLSYLDNVVQNKRLRKTLIRPVATYGAEYLTAIKDIGTLLAAF